jgi:putative salt-induced outer membrane protein YdiY
MSRRRVVPCACLLCLLLLLPSAARADEVRLANGDRLTGTVVRLEGGTLTFKTSGGELKLPWKDVTALVMDHPLLVLRTGAEPVSETIDAQTPEALAAIEDIHAPVPPVIWHGSASAGILNTGGNTDVSSLRIDSEVTARRPVDRSSAGFTANRSVDRDVETARNWTATLGYDRFFDTRPFANVSLILTHDRFRDLDLRSALSAGIGYQAWQSPMATLSVTAGYGYVRENFATSPDDSYSAFEEGLKLDAKLAGQRVQAFHHHSGFFGLTGNDNLFWRMQNGLKLPLVARLVTTFEFDLDYDRNPAPGRVSTDRTFSLTFGYQF